MTLHIKIFKDGLRKRHVLLGTPHMWGPLITWVLLITGDSSYLENPHTRGPDIPGDLSYLVTLNTWGPLYRHLGTTTYLGTPHTW